jgi:hypothetical protein|tara:strand:- start:435 stop:581 length:147 start_codon:yes stop_codon:yes gene_type:complete
MSNRPIQKTYDTNTSGSIVQLSTIYAPFEDYSKMAEKQKKGKGLRELR